MTVRIAMWSGPRNISTALMRSWGARADCAVSDEPLYAHYLGWLGRTDPSARDAHPVWREVVASQSTDWREVVRTLTGPAPGGRGVWYQKHMAHHLTPEMIEQGGREAMASMRHVMLIRDPGEMITSFVKVIAAPTPEHLGLPQQVELGRWLERHTGEHPAVVDAEDVLRDPAGVLRGLCARLGVAYDGAMLSWEPGPRATDGVWGPHWYSSVYETTGFGPWRRKDERVPERLAEVHRVCLGLYEQLAAHRITTAAAAG